MDPLSQFFVSIAIGNLSEAMDRYTELAKPIDPLLLSEMAQAMEALERVGRRCGKTVAVRRQTVAQNMEQHAELAAEECGNRSVV